MPSRFQGLAKHPQPTPYYTDWDVYDNVPLDAAYVAPVGLAACTRKPTV